MSASSPNNTAVQSLQTYVTRDLGYCCLEFFFGMYRKNSEISDRLGLSEYTIKQWRARVNKGNCACTSGEGCMRLRLGKPNVRRTVMMVKEMRQESRSK